MQQQRLILSVSACITLVLLGVLVVLSKPLFQNKVRNIVTTLPLKFKLDSVANKRREKTIRLRA